MPSKQAILDPYLNLSILAQDSDPPSWDALEYVSTIDAKTLILEL
jgi:hypothetical protein